MKVKSKKSKPKKAKKFDWAEFDEAVEYFVRRFTGEDVTISTAGTLIRVMPGGPPHTSQKTGNRLEYSVLRNEDGWNVWELRRDGDLLLKTCRSYEQAAVFLEKRILANAD